MDEPTTYAALLRAAIKAAKSSRRKLSAELAEETGNKQETEYRSLGKYLSKTKPELPSRERAAILAVLLGESKLALVSDAQERRRDRLEELSKTVQQLRDEFDRFVRSASKRRADLEKAPELPTRQEDRPSSPGAK